MPTIKGPIVVNKDNTLLDVILENPETEIKHPFEAVGWMSEKNYDKVKGGKKLGGKPDKPDKPKPKPTEVKPVAKPVVAKPAVAPSVIKKGVGGK